jgi:hypothetical protein
MSDSCGMSFLTPFTCKLHHIVKIVNDRSVGGFHVELGTLHIDTCIKFCVCDLHLIMIHANPL